MIFQTVIGGYNSLDLVSWATGTPAQLAAMLDAHYKGRINIANYWNIGDSRAVPLGAIAANNCTDAMNAQAAQLVLMNAGGKTLVTAEHGKTTCAFVVGLKNSLSGTGKWGGGSSFDYSASVVRPFLNNEFFLSLPSDLQALFKAFVNTTTKSGGTENTEDLFALPAAIEVFGAATSVPTTEGSQFDYYKTSANRIKTISGQADSYWLRTKGSGYGSAMYVTYGGYLNTSGSLDTKQGISPFGVI